ncbi:MAG: hypothetical protein RL386_1939 [Bacteroidota bacterium]
MCGIGGILLTKAITLEPAARARAITGALAHRGPDGSNYYADARACLVHTRLSIIDLSDAGTQPFFGGDNREIVSLVNGEIYNFQGLREMLLQEGIALSSQTDSEIVPHLYARYGPGFVEKIQGMFAIALYNSRTGQLLLIRDRFGIKPLYYTYCQETGIFCFASELKAILCHPEIGRHLDAQAVHDFLSLGYVPEPATGFKGIHTLLPGNYLTLEGAEVSVRPYWQLGHSEKKGFAGNTKAAAALTTQVLSRAVKSQLISDAPLGVFLSGGIDSIQVANQMALALFPEKVSSFTVKFPGVQQDESQVSGKAAACMDTRHHELPLGDFSLSIEAIERLIQHFDQPFADSSLIPTFLISQAVGKKIKVVLSGDGGDEFSAGYPKFRQFRWILRLKSIPAILRRMVLRWIPAKPDIARKIRKLLSLTFMEQQEILFRLSSYMDEAEKIRAYTPGFLAKIKGVRETSRCFNFSGEAGEDLMQQISRVQQRTSLPAKMLRKTDMMSMLAGIEVRVPLLDEAYVAWMFDLPSRFKVRHGKGKWLNRKMLEKKFGAAVAWKKKVGFDAPLDQLKGLEMNKYLADKLLKDQAKISGIVDKAYIAELLNQLSQGTAVHSDISRSALIQRLFSLLCLELWLEKYDVRIE